MLDPLEFGHDLVAAVPSLRAYATALTQDPDEARGLIQETLMRGWRARASFQPDVDLGVWLKQILRNCLAETTNVRRREIPVGALVR